MRCTVHKNKLAIICPCYNEEESLPESSKKLRDLLSSLIKREVVATDSFIMLVNDGSIDRTWEIIKSLNEEDSNIFKGISLSRNFGHQSALLCGLMEVSADIYVSIDIDLQDDISNIEKMIDKYNAGSEIVYGVRNNRNTDSFFKRKTALLYYKLLSFLGVRIIPNHADFRLMSAKAINKLRLYKERNLFLRGIIPLLGMKSDEVSYKRLKREQGSTKYTLTKMVRLALDGIFAFSVSPLKIISAIGLLFVIVSFIMFTYVFISYIDKSVIRGWASLMGSLYLIGGLVLLSLSIIGEYIARVYNETKQRPLYIIETETK